MNRTQFEQVAQEALESLPEHFLKKLDNVHIVVEDYPSDDVVRKRGDDRYSLLGLYEGIPLPHRGPWYGTYPTSPDKITLYQKNIEAVCGSEKEIRRRVYEVLFHEIGHYFGMNEQEVREALKDFE